MSLMNESTSMTMPVVPALYGNTGGNGNGMFGDNGIAWLVLLALLFGWGGNRGGFGNQGGGGVVGVPVYGGGCGSPCATQADVRAAVDQQTLISKIDQQTYGMADTFTALNNTINSNFRGVDNAICTLGYQTQNGFNQLGAQLAQCCCDTRAAIQANTTQGVMNTNAIQSQIAMCCCDLEKANMQNRFDAQNNTCNTLQAIDKLGDRIIGWMSNEKTQSLRDENQALRLAASQANQNNVIRAAIDASTAEIIRRTGNDCPTPAYWVQPPTPVQAPCGWTQGYNGGCGCGNGYGA